MKNLFSPLALGLALALAATTAGAQNISVQTAWYGQSCGTAHGNVSSHVKWRCDGRPSCSYFVDANVVGDPAPNCTKNLVVMYGCSGQTALRLAQLPAEASGRTINFGCQGIEPTLQR